MSRYSYTNILCLKILKVCRTDCVKVENLTEDASDDAIKVSFSNKSLIKGQVTHVLRCESDNTKAYVYYDNYKGIFALAAFIQIIAAKSKSLDNYIVKKEKRKTKCKRTFSKKQRYSLYFLINCAFLDFVFKRLYLC